LIIEYLRVEGPIELQPLPETHRRIFFCEPVDEAPLSSAPPSSQQAKTSPKARPTEAQPRKQATNDCARTIIATFAKRAFRRPVSQKEVERLLGVFQDASAAGESFENSAKLALEAVLVSPHFLFRGELQVEPDNPGKPYPVDDYGLASRLSYFLWSSMPDEELFRAAEKGTLRKNLDAHVKRMLKDPKAHALVENFAGQWLQLRNLKLAAPDPKQFPNFDEGLRASMLKETELFFEYILKEDRSMLEFIDADYTFADERLAALYGLEGVKGDSFERLSLSSPPTNGKKNPVSGSSPSKAKPASAKSSARGGLLTQASILTITSNPTRTSPVKRGKWILENILGAPPPPPPPNVPKLDEGKHAELTGTLRQRMEQHRDDPACASCHARMDPIGFSFENYDGIGAWREKDGDFAIDPSGALVSGEAFSGPAGLKAILLNEKRDEFLRCLTEKVLTYALGRGLEYYDKCAVDAITAKLKRDRYKFSSLILEVTRSTPFQMRRGEAPKETAANINQ